MVQIACRAQSPSEEFANSLSHHAGALLAAVFSPELIGNAPQAGTIHGLAAAVYCGSMILLYAVSAAYHWLAPGPAKRCCIGSTMRPSSFSSPARTRPSLGALAEQGGYWVLGLVWLIATAGIVAKCANRLKYPYLSTALYLGLGWLSVFILKPLMNELPVEGLALIVSGGVLYTLGAVVFHFDERVPYAHFAWHLLVLGAGGCHFVAVMRYAAG